MDKIKLKSKITCPSCGFNKVQSMPENACLYFYECTNCAKIIKPKKGDCCVFCSYGDIKCPPIQNENKSCCGL